MFRKIHTNDLSNEKKKYFSFRFIHDLEWVLVERLRIINCKMILNKVEVAIQCFFLHFQLDFETIVALISN